MTNKQTIIIIAGIAILLSIFIFFFATKEKQPDVGTVANSSTSSYASGSVLVDSVSTTILDALSSISWLRLSNCTGGEVWVNFEDDAAIGNSIPLFTSAVTTGTDIDVFGNIAHAKVTAISGSGPEKVCYTYSTQ